ncbi:NineTeen Complex (NTC) component, partial [Nowakowskiella sp. JEL0078]
MNDEINRLLREKRHWEYRIKELGGSDYTRLGGKQYDSDGKEVPGIRGYKYFGRAKELPGVRELFQQAAPEAQPKTRHEMIKTVDSDYYGYRDEDDGILLAFEAEYENRELEKLESMKVTMRSNETIQVNNLSKKQRTSLNDEEGEFHGIVAIPTQKEIEESLVSLRKD